MGARFEQDRVAAQPVSGRRFDACVIHPGQVDKFQTVRFDRNSYSVPRRWAFRSVTVKGYVDRVEVVGDGTVIATHTRSYGSGVKVLDPLHFLVVLERKPGALDHAPVYRDWQLPVAFATLRRSLEERLGGRVGAKHYIRVLQLLASHPITRVETIITRCLASGDLDAAIIVEAVRRHPSDNALSLSDNALSLSDNAPSLDLSAVTVPAPDLAQFDRLLSRSPEGGDADEC